MTMLAGVTKANEGLDKISWNILGQTYVPKQLSENAFSWHAVMPVFTVVPPHILPTHDDFLYILDGRFAVILIGLEPFAEPGDLVRLPMGIPHGIFNKTNTAIKCMFWVTPSRKLYDLFWALHNLGPKANPADVVATSAQFEIDFLPPPEAS